MASHPGSIRWTQPPGKETLFVPGVWIEEQLRKIIQKQNWAYLDVRINYYEPFKEAYGCVAGDDVLRFTGLLIGEVLDGLGTVNDFVGHAGGDNFVIITAAERANAIRDRLKARFAAEVVSHYTFIDRDQGFVRMVDKKGQLRKRL